jgi:hypothetical protein
MIAWSKFGNRPNRVLIQNTYSTKLFNKALSDLILEKNVFTEIIPDSDENGEWVIGNSFRQLGILKNPKVGDISSDSDYIAAAGNTLRGLRFASVSTAFTVGSTIQGATSSAKALVDKISGAGSSTIIYYHQSEATGFTQFQEAEAITELNYYSGEFDIEWGKSVVYGGPHEWHNTQIDKFNDWLVANNKDPNDINLSLGYLPIGQVNLSFSFGTLHEQTIQQILSNHLDIYKIEVDGVSNTFDYCWSDYNYKQMQINIMKPGYDYSSRR